MTGSPADEDYATLSGYWEGWEADAAPVVVLGCAHHPMCLVARHPDPSTWETPGFPWCTCPQEFREARAIGEAAISEEKP